VEQFMFGEFVPSCTEATERVDVPLRRESVLGLVHSAGHAIE